MPRLSKLRIGALAGLAQQLRFAPKKRIAAQLLSATALAGEIDPDRTYPEDWVVFRITGYRPEMDEPTLIIGEALRGDLSAFVERISDRAEITVSDLPPFLGIDALLERWDVSKKTIERARRRGLIAQRYRDDEGNVRLAFTLSAIESYEKYNTEAVRAAGAFDRIDDAESDRIATIGARAMRRFGWSMNDTAQRLARRTGRGRETMRQLLRRTAKDEPAIPGALPPRDRRIIDRAAQRSIPVSVLADRYERTPAAIRLIVNQRRLSRLKRWRLPTGDVIVINPPSDSSSRFMAPGTIGEFIKAANESGKPDAKTERELATLHRSLLVNAGAIARSTRRSGPSAAALDRAEADLRYAAILRAALVGSELELALLTIEGRLGAPLAALAPSHAVLAHDASIDALIGAAANFDPSRGGRLAASAGLAINKALAPIERAIRDRPDPRGGSGETPQARLTDWTCRVAPWCRWLGLPPGFAGAAPTLPEPNRAAITLLHGLTDRPPMTPSEIADSLGMSRIAVVRMLGATTRLLRESVRTGAGAGAVSNR